MPASALIPAKRYGVLQSIIVRDLVICRLLEPKHLIRPRNRFQGSRQASPVRIVHHVANCGERVYPEIGGFKGEAKLIVVADLAPFLVSRNFH